MAPTIKYILIFMWLYTASSSIRFVSSSLITCHPQLNYFLHDLQLQCPLSISSSSVLQINGEALEHILSPKPKNVYTAVLLYASWCPFSEDMRFKISILSSMFPQIQHIEVEQSETLPSVFSRYGIHSVPALLIVNQRAKMRYSGPKDLLSLARFYKKTTGLDPVKDLTHGDFNSIMAGRKALQTWHPFFWHLGLDPVKDLTHGDFNSIMAGRKALQTWHQLSWIEMILKEPYLVLATVFLILRAFLYFFPEIFSRIRTLWVMYKMNLNLGMLGESRQLCGHIMHLIDVKMVWSKLKLCKTRNFHEGARNARVWASSLASMSLGETSARSISSLNS